MDKFKKANLRIDHKNIDLEILRQAQLYYEWSYSAAEAENIRDDEKEILEIISSRIENGIRENIESYFESKPTEAAIKNVVNNNPKVMNQRRIYNEAKAKARLLKVAEKSYEQRKDMIEAYLRREDKRRKSEVRVPVENLRNAYRKKLNEKS